MNASYEPSLQQRRYRRLPDLGVHRIVLLHCNEATRARSLVGHAETKSDASSDVLFGLLLRQKLTRTPRSSAARSGSFGRAIGTADELVSAAYQLSVHGIGLGNKILTMDLLPSALVPGEPQLLQRLHRRDALPIDVAHRTLQ